MLKKVFTPSWTTEAQPPQLVDHYKSAQYEVFQCHTHVPATRFSAFEVKEDDLHDAGIDLQDFALTVTVALETWVHSKSLHCVPTPVFLGPWAQSKYIKIHESETVIMLRPKEVDRISLLHSERLVALTYIDLNQGVSVPVPFSHAVDAIRSILSKEWLALYESDADRSDLIAEVLQGLAITYHKSAHSYQQLIRMIA